MTLSMLLIWGKLVLKKEPIHNPTRLVYHEDKKGFINCICNEDFNLFSLFGLRLVFQTEQKKKANQVQEREVLQYSGTFLLILNLFFFFSNIKAKKANHSKSEQETANHVLASSFVLKISEIRTFGNRL